MLLDEAEATLEFKFFLERFFEPLAHLVQIFLRLSFVADRQFDVRLEFNYEELELSDLRSLHAA